jgi:hypothetical protein
MNAINGRHQRRECPFTDGPTESDELAVVEDVVTGQDVWPTPGERAENRARTGGKPMRVDDIKVASSNSPSNTSKETPAACISAQWDVI